MSDALYPVVHSVLSPNALLVTVLDAYDLPTPAVCKFHNKGLNDTYVVEAGDQQFVFRVYRREWRSLDDIGYELDAVRFLSDRGLAVSTVLPDRSGGYLQSFDAPEGKRYGALFTWATGEGDDWEESTAARIGSVMAMMHNVSDDFSSRHPRYCLDVDHLIDTPVGYILPYLAKRPDDAAYVRQLAEKIRSRFLSLSNDLDYGFCHGDMHGGNIHIDNDDTVTIFDFDCCGRGWRAFDLAVYRWSGLRPRSADRRWPAFLRGYKERRDLAEIDLASIEFFINVRQLWYLGLNTRLGIDDGRGWLHTQFWNEAIAFLKAHESS